ncbi:MAG: hypothetical protein P8046_05530 [Anaerolineales bacterium]|jgi:hypothetical protein
MEDKKRLGLIITIVTVLLCGCPGLCTMAFGAMMTMGNSLENYGWEVSGNPTAVGIAFLCLSVIMVAIPIGAGIYTFVQSRKETEIDDIEVPPAL